MKIEYFSRDNTPQSSCLSLLHCDVEIRFLAAEDKYMTLSRVMLCDVPSSSLIVNCMVPMPSASELPATPLTPTVVDRSIVVNSSNCEHIWCVAQLSVPNSVLVGANEQRLVSNFVVLELARTRTSERSNVSVTRQRGAANGKDADLSLGGQWAMEESTESLSR